MSDQVITRRNEHAATRQKRTSCQLSEDGKTLAYGGFRFTLIARGQRTHRVGVLIGQEEAFYNVALKSVGWSDEEIKNGLTDEVKEQIKGALFDRRDTPYGAGMAFDFRVDAGMVCNEASVAGTSGTSVSSSVQQGGGFRISSALDALKSRVDVMRAQAGTSSPTGKTKK